MPRNRFSLPTALMGTTSIAALWSNIDQAPSLEGNLSPDTATVRRDREWGMRLQRAAANDAAFIAKGGSSRMAGYPR